MKQFFAMLTAAVLTMVLTLGAPEGGLLREKLAAPVTAEAAYNAFSDKTLTEYHIRSVSDMTAFLESTLDFYGKTVYLDSDIDMKARPTTS